LGIAGNYLTFALVAIMMFYSLQSSAFVSGHIEKDQGAPEGKFSIDPELKGRVERYMSEEKPYLHHLLNLDHLSARLSMSSRALSAVIKHSFKTNFYEFVNSYRIEEAKSILSDPTQKDKTMIEIAGECGFNSKATYNTFFKKLVGSTPTEYRKLHLP
jgi:AraC-like DNA-binding protein